MPVWMLAYFPAVKDAPSSGHATIKAVTLRLQGD